MMPGKPTCPVCDAELIRLKAGFLTRRRGLEPFGCPAPDCKVGTILFGWTQGDRGERARLAPMEVHYA